MLPIQPGTGEIEPGIGEIDPGVGEIKPAAGQILPDNPFKFSGKELTEGSGTPLYDFGARWYLPTLPRWTTPDPLSEKYYSISPYAYCAGNPVNLVDPTGNGPVDCIITYHLISHRLEFHSNSSTLRTLGYSMSHPYIAYMIGPGKENYSGISATAARFAINVMNAAGLRSNQEGTPKNAFRHVLWQSMITSEFGEETAIRVGNAHEISSMTDYNQYTFSTIAEADLNVDLRNNEIGRQIAIENPDSSNISLALRALYYYHTQGLWIIEKSNDEFVIYQRKLNDDEYQKALKELTNLHQDGLKH